MIKDNTEFEKFFRLLPDLERDEVYFISLSARNKYLTDEERVKYHLGRTEMFGREIIYEKLLDNFNTIMKKLETVPYHRKTKNGSTIPSKCMVTYINLNPSSSIQSLSKFMEEMNKELFNYVTNLQKGNCVDTNLHRFKNCRSILNKQFQRSASRKLFIDIDIDSTDKPILDEACKILEQNGCKFFVVQTQGGYHVCVDRKTLKFNYVHDVIGYCNKMIDISDGEYSGIVENNKNFMIPVPGTMQAGKLVKLIYCNY